MVRLKKIIILCSFLVGPYLFAGENPQEVLLAGVEDFEKEKKSSDFSLESGGEWLPEEKNFKPFLADPRQLTYSLAYRFYDDVIGRHSIGVSLGEELFLYRWDRFPILKTSGSLQLAIIAGAWAVFNFDSNDDFAEIVNADYFIGFQSSYAYDKSSYRLRMYHMSSHLGDEFLLAHPQVERLNPSFEAIDFFASYQLTEAIRGYGGVGYIFRSDRTFSLHPLYAELGVELRLLGKVDERKGLFMQPFFGMHFRHWEDRGWESDSTYVLGCEWGKLKGGIRQTRLYMEYHDGFSLEGQFSKDPTTYLSLNFGIGY